MSPELQLVSNYVLQEERKTKDVTNSITPPMKRTKTNVTLLSQVQPKANYSMCMHGEQMPVPQMPACTLWIRDFTVLGREGEVKHWTSW